MSDTDAPPQSAAAPADPPAPTPIPAKKRGRWRRRVLATLIVIAALVLVLRVLIAVAFPLVLDRVVAFYNLSCTYDRVNLSMLDGNLNLYNLTIRPKEGGEEIAHADYVFGNISPLELLRGRLFVYRLETDGINLNIDRTADGRVPLIDRLFPPTTVSKTTATPIQPRTLDLQAPLHVEAFRLSYTNLTINDQSVSPPLQTQVQVNLRVSDLGSTRRPTSFDLSVSADKLLDELRVSGQAKANAQSLDANMQVQVRGLRPGPAAGYLAPFGIRPVCDQIAMQMQATVNAKPSATVPGAATGTLSIDDLGVGADNQQAVAIDHLQFDIDSIDTTAAHIAQVVLDGAKLHTTRSAQGAPGVCGFELTSAPPSKSAPATPSATQPTTPSPVPAYGLSIAAVRLKDCRLDLADAAVSPPTVLSVQLEELTAAAADPGKGPIAIAGRLTVPGIIDQIDIAGSTRPFDKTRTANLTVKATGLAPTALKPYVDALGLQSQFKNGTFGCELTAALKPRPDGSLWADAHLTKLVLADQEELFGLSDVDIAGFTADARRVRLDSVEITGPTLLIRRDADGAVSVAGFKTKRVVTETPVNSASSLTPGSTAHGKSSGAKLPNLEIGRFIWKGARVALTDEAVTPPQTISIDDLGVEMRDLKLTADSTDFSGNHGTIKAWLAAPRFCNRGTLDGTISSTRDTATFDLDVNGSGVSPASLAPYLKPLGVEPLLENGHAKLHALVTLAKTPGGLSTSLKLTDAHLATDRGDLLGADSLEVDGLQNRSVDQIVIDHPRAEVERDADGNLIIAGIKLLKSTGQAAAPMTTALPTIRPPTGKQPASPPSVMTLKHLHIQDAVLSWTDRAVKPAVQSALTSTIDLDHLTLGRDAEPATLRLTAAIDGIIRQATIAGTVTTDPAKQGAQLDVAANGITLGPLIAYLPSGVTGDLSEGSLKLKLDAAVADNAAGGHSAKLILSDLDYRDGDHPLAKVGRFTLSARRIDPAGNVIAIDEVSSAGVEGTMALGDNGTMRALGLSLGRAPASAAPKPATTEPAPVPIVAPAGATPTAAQLVSAANKPLPLITVEKLDLNVKRWSVVDATRPGPGGAQLEIDDLRLHNVNRIEWLGHNPDSKPPTQLELTTRVAPIADHMAVEIKSAPFALQPWAAVDFSVSGIRGDGVTQLMPELKPQIDGSGMTDGVAAGHVGVALKLERRVPTDFDLSRGYGVDFSLAKVEFRSSPTSPVLAGVEEVRSEGIRVRPEGKGVEVKSLEITRPAAFVVRDKEGIKALGLLLKSPPPTTRPASPTVAAAPAKASPAQPKPTSEIKIDRILVDGLDVRVEDRTTTPVTVIPLNGLDLEARDLSSLAPYEDKPMRFNALLSAGKIQVGNGESPADQRDLFSQISAAGRIGLYPELNGWAKTSVDGFELAGLTGEAKAQGVTLTKGTFDSDIDLHFEPRNIIDTRSKLVFTDLSLSEPPKGVIERGLALPAPLDVVIGALEDADGSITLPLSFQLKNLQPEGIGAAASGAVLSVVTVAIASAPLKAAADVGNLLGLGGAKNTKPEAPIVLTFDPGAVALEPAQQVKLAELAQRMIKDPKIIVTISHELGEADVAAASDRANPPVEEAANLALELRARKLALSQLRAQAAGEAEAQLASFSSSDAEPALLRLRAIDRDLAATENALDHVYELLRPGAQRQALRRTRATAIEFAAQRLAGVRALLAADGVPDVDHRVKLMNPRYNPSDQPAGDASIQAIRTHG